MISRGLCLASKNSLLTSSERQTGKTKRWWNDFQKSWLVCIWFSIFMHKHLVFRTLDSKFRRSWSLRKFGFWFHKNNKTFFYQNFLSEISLKHGELLFCGLQAGLVREVTFGTMKEQMLIIEDPNPLKFERSICWVEISKHWLLWLLGKNGRKHQYLTQNIHGFPSTNSMKIALRCSYRSTFHVSRIVTETLVVCHWPMCGWFMRKGTTAFDQECGSSKAVTVLVRGGNQMVGVPSTCSWLHPHNWFHV